MASLVDTDRFDESRNAQKVCLYCGAPVAQTRSSTTVGMCTRHEAIFREDINAGLHLQNRLKELILKSASHEI